MSATVRPMGPLIEKNESGPGAAETRLRDGLMPYDPHHDDGFLIDPPPSEPCEIGHSPATNADAAPPEDPPQVRSRSHGLRPGGYAGGSLTLSGPNSGATVLPRITKPARADLRDDRVVAVGDAVAPRRGAVRRADARRVVQVLDRDRDTVERGQVGALTEGLLRDPSGVERIVRGDRQIRAEPRIDALDALQVELSELDWRHLALADHRGLIERRDEREIVTHSTQQYRPLDLP